jgi:hypothetical protein
MTPSRPRPSARRLAAAVALAAPLAVLASAPPARVADPIALAAPPSFEAAVLAIERATGARATPFAPAAEAPPIEGRTFALDAATADRLLAGSHAALREAGLYLFRYERGLGLPGEHDHVALLATADPYAVIRRMKTGGAPRTTTEQVVAWLQEVEREAPFDLLDVGADYLAGRFRRPVADPEAMARRTIAIAPALLSGGEREVALLAEEIRANRTLYLIW